MLCQTNGQVLPDILYIGLKYWKKNQSSQSDRGRTHWDPNKACAVCKKRQCQTCPRMVHSGRIVSHVTGRTYHAPIGANCQSNNLIYLITCKTCHAQYVGETYRNLGQRIYEHLYSIRKKGNTPVADHFNSPGHSIDDVQVEVISNVYLHVPQNCRKGIEICRLVEKKWIHKLKTSQYPGLNILD